MEELVIVCDSCGEEFQPNVVIAERVVGQESSADFIAMLFMHQNDHHLGKEPGTFQGWTVLLEGEL